MSIPCLIMFNCTPNGWETQTDRENSETKKPSGGMGGCFCIGTSLLGLHSWRELFLIIQICQWNALHRQDLFIQRKTDGQMWHKQKHKYSRVRVCIWCPFAIWLTRKQCWHTCMQTMHVHTETRPTTRRTEVYPDIIGFQCIVNLKLGIENMHCSPPFLAVVSHH